MAGSIAIYGGTFDPPHLGHLGVADAIIEAFGLDLMLLVPAAVPPHKRRQAITSPWHRLAMLTLATAQRPKMRVSTVELESPSRPYTIETLGKLGEEYPGARLFFVMGADSFRDIDSWREHDRILTEYSVIVAMRPGSEPIGGVTSHLRQDLRARVVDLRGGQHPSAADLSDNHVFLTDYVCVDISATDVREAAAAGISLVGMVPPEVAGYIAKYQLYRSRL